MLEIEEGGSLAREEAVEEAVVKGGALVGLVVETVEEVLEGDGAAAELEELEAVVASVVVGVEEVAGGVEEAGAEVVSVGLVVEGAAELVATGVVASV